MYRVLSHDTCANNINLYLLNGNQKIQKIKLHEKVSVI